MAMSQVSLGYGTMDISKLTPIVPNEFMTCDIQPSFPPYPFFLAEEVRTQGNPYMYEG